MQNLKYLSIIDQKKIRLNFWIKIWYKGTLPIQGGDHNLNYISNRTFETITKGHIVITNNILAHKPSIHMYMKMILKR